MQMMLSLVAVDDGSDATAVRGIIISKRQSDRQRHNMQTQHGKSLTGPLVAGSHSVSNLDGQSGNRQSDMQSRRRGVVGVVIVDSCVDGVLSSSRLATYRWCKGSNEISMQRDLVRLLATQSVWNLDGHWV